MKLKVSKSLIAIVLLSALSNTGNATCYTNNIESHSCRFPAGDAWCAENYTGVTYAYNTSCINKQKESSSSSSETSSDGTATAAVIAGGVILGLAGLLSLYGGDDSSSSSSNSSSSDSGSSDSGSSIPYVTVEFDPFCGLLLSCSAKSLSVSGGPSEFSEYAGASGAIHKGDNGLAGNYSWRAQVNDKVCSGSFYLSGKKRNLVIKTSGEDCTTSYYEY